MQIHWISVGKAREQVYLMGVAGTDQKSVIVLLGGIFIYSYWCNMRSSVKIDSFPGSESNGKKLCFPVMGIHVFMVHCV